MKEQRREPTFRNPDELEPQAESRAVPVWLIIGFGLLFYASTMYLDRHAGGFKEKVYEPYASLKALQANHPKSAAGEQFEAGRKVYSTYCSPCHQPSGMGAAGVAPPLVGSEWVLTPGAGRMVRVILHGLAGPIKVKGVDFNGAMVPWKDALKDEDIAAVATFVRQNKDWGPEHNAPAVKPEDVKAIRDATASRAAAWTQPEIEEVAPDSNQ